MSIVYSVDIFCDGNNCSNQAHGITRVRVTPGDVRKFPATDEFKVGLKGWARTIEGEDFCPDCKEIHQSAYKAARDARLIEDKAKGDKKLNAPVTSRSDFQWGDF